MQCLACGADNKMLLMDVVRDDTMKVPAFDHHIYRCSACRHIARRLVFSRAKMPTTHLPVITTPIDKPWKERVAAPSALGNAVEKLRSRQIDLKGAPAAKTAAWAEEAAVASRLRLAEPVRAAATPPASPVSPVPNEAPAPSERLGARAVEKVRARQDRACGG
jgi:hypothetical protein